MLSLCIKRHIVHTAPWVFGQSELPSKYKVMDQIEFAQHFIREMGPGFTYAFESIVQSYCDKDHEVLQNCLEPALYSHVSEKLDNFQEKDINFVRISNETLKILPLSLGVHIGLYKDRSKNPKMAINELPINSPEMNSMSSMMPKLPPAYEGFVECLHFYPMSPLSITNIVIAVEAAFFGKPALGLFRENEQLSKKGPENEYHILKFETDFEIPGLFKFTMGGFNLFQAVDKMNWIVSDIDNIFRGNPYFRNN